MSHGQNERVPQVSVIVRAHNRKRYLEEALCSLRLQNVELEVIIVQDGNQDLRIDFKQCLGDVPFTHVVLKKIRGRVFAANTGIDLARGEFICFLDDDDIFYPYHLSTLIESLRKNPHYRVAYTDALEAKQEPWGGFYVTTSLNLKLSKDYRYSSLRKDNFIPILCCLFHRDVVRDRIRMDSKVEVLEDWDFWLQIAKREPFLHIPETTCEYRVRTDRTNTTGQVSHLWSYSKKYIVEKHKLDVEVQ